MVYDNPCRDCEDRVCKCVLTCERWKNYIVYRDSMRAKVAVIREEEQYKINTSLRIKYIAVKKEHARR